MKIESASTDNITSSTVSSIAIAHVTSLSPPSTGVMSVSVHGVGVVRTVLARVGAGVDANDWVVTVVTVDPGGIDSVV